MAGVFELDMDGTSSVPGAGGSGPGGGGGGLGAGALDGAGSNGGNEVVEVDEENMSKDAMAVDIREMKEPDMQKLNEDLLQDPSMETVELSELNVGEVGSGGAKTGPRDFELRKVGSGGAKT